MKPKDGQTTSISKTAEADAEANRAALDERRSAWMAAKEDVARAEKKEALVAERLAANGERHSADEAELKAAVDRQAELKRALKASAEQREVLRKARSNAHRDAEEAQKLADAAEAKYDKSLQAEILATQKSQDLSAHDGQVPGSDDEAPASATALPFSASDPQSTAQKTAAAVTARKARA